MPETSNETPAPRASSWRDFAALFASLAFLICVSAFLLSRIPSFADLGTSISEDDFKTNIEQIEFINRHLPEPLPTQSQVKKIRYEAWQDWNLESVVELPTDAGRKYITKIRGLEISDQDPDENTARFELSGNSLFAGNLIFDVESGILRIECFSW